MNSGSSSPESVEQSLTNTADGTEGDTVGKWLYEVFALLYTGAEQRIQRHKAWNGEDMLITDLNLNKPTATLCIRLDRLLLGIGAQYL